MRWDFRKEGAIGSRKYQFHTTFLPPKSSFGWGVHSPLLSRWKFGRRPEVKQYYILLGRFMILLVIRRKRR